MPQPASLSVQCIMTRSGNAFMNLSSAPGHQWSPESSVSAGSPLAVHPQPLEYTDANVETTVDPILVFENGQCQILSEQSLISPLPTATVPAQHCIPVPPCLVLPPLMTNCFQKEQLALYKLFDSEQRLQEAVDAATPRHAPKCTGKKKKQGNRFGVYKCQFCDYTSNRSFNTKQHENTHFDPPIRPHKCIICERGFVRKYDLKVHHQMHIREIREMMKSCGLVLM
ncbi:hypothetical protein BC940DRAFT_358335 [Gongronella butleri]|nr:hypothetical protein BC940DRAFT_358335 [Gongronella butleri]